MPTCAVRACAELRGPGARGRAGRRRRCRRSRVGQVAGRGRRARVRGHAGPAAQHAGGLLAPRVARTRARARHDHASRREEQGVPLRACSCSLFVCCISSLCTSRTRAPGPQRLPEFAGPSPSSRFPHRGLQTIPLPHLQAQTHFLLPFQYGHVTGRKERKESGRWRVSLSECNSCEALPTWETHNVRLIARGACCALRCVSFRRHWALSFARRGQHTST